MDHAQSPYGSGTEFVRPPVGAAAIEAQGLGKEYRRGWALRDVSFRLPAGRVCGLVGPNGAGKSTLMGLATNMIRPTTGALRVFGAAPGSTEAVLRTAFLTQEKPLFRRFTVAETLRLGREFNPHWDQEVAEGIVRAGQVPLKAKVGTLSGGQRTRVAFALAFGKRPDLLILDEPMADLDPLVSRELMATLTAEAAEHGTTVLVSSHMLAELEHICDYLLVVANGGLRLAGEVDELRAAHALLDVAGSGPVPAVAPHTVIESGRGDGRPGVLVRLGGPVAYGGPAEPPTLEELLLAYLRSPDAPALITPSARVGDIHDIITRDRTKAVTA
ncbi:ABC transporter ATP-binding protein [Streptomyces sp. NE06-03E]|uniref:ABC transporter ATP-binding protein n=1 Tax=Streptomyces sp. NE06-03E TaxID=3028695 RepID=UPI0029BCA2CF|nr:ABC transporter ATP-binding protein [Streptomyces sp. NE06-03E]MDX3059216.1 ABC transporter ATP-binding protein [Streptomyces sp. NE06-03E]